ncbi:hypothetical protein Dda_7164 [Drechslerella dactyloides]|uniref:FHA domain-containing protein n=1 Tax=Drechslerella dactyloides TaxID=74499 RepID=A0AAD6ITA0_DREDA|nr:hypothetical protein Dda_7164 [Drechslerella dactyloides]
MAETCGPANKTITTPTHAASSQSATLPPQHSEITTTTTTTVPPSTTTVTNITVTTTNASPRLFRTRWTARPVCPSAALQFLLSACLSSPLPSSLPHHSSRITNLDIDTAVEMATPPLSSSPVLTRGSRRQQHDHANIPPSSPPPFLGERRSLKRTASASSSIDPDSPSARPSKRRAVRSQLKRCNSTSQSEVGNENARPLTVPVTPSKILKRTPSLLPAIDFQPSPPRGSSRSYLDQPLSEMLHDIPLKKENHYPTPLPTSEISIPTSPTRNAATAATRSGLGRANSAISELRGPLASVPTVVLPKDPTPVTFGRSANKCTYLLSKSHLVSRVHFKVCYLGYGLRKEVEVHCVGFNGAKIHCKGDIYELGYGDKFWSQSGADIMLEIADARVVIRWPNEFLSPTSPLSPAVRPVVLDHETFPFPPEYDEALDTKQNRWPTEGVDKFNGFTGDPVAKLGNPRARHGLLAAAAFSEPAPLRLSPGIWSAAPESPCPRPRQNRLVSPNHQALQSPSCNPAVTQSPFNPFLSMTSQATFTLYEDEDDDVNPIVELPIEQAEDDGFILRESEKPEAHNVELDMMDQEEDDENDFEEVVFDEDDEEDFENSRETILSTTPKKAYKMHKLDESVKQDPLSPKSKQSITKHLTNQLAFSRLASTPLSNLFKSLPTAVIDKVSLEFIQGLLTSVACIGEIKREGKDASGKPLEAEYYYIADMDDDEDRKAIIGSLAKPSLRACRKVHKQYFWKKPKV